MKVRGLDSEAVRNTLLDAFSQAGTARSYVPHQIISRFDDAEPRIYLVAAGAVAINVDDQTGNEMTVAHCIPGNVFGLVDYHPDDELRQIEIAAIAKSKCTVLELKRGELLEVGKTNPELLLHVCSSLSQRFAEVAQKAGQFAFFDVRGRVASVLIELSQLPDAISHPLGFILSSTRQEIASMVGCSREMVGRVMQDLSAQGHITLMGRQTLVHAEQHSS